MFEVNCSRQMGQHKKKIFHQMFLCLQRFVCQMQMQIVIVLLEYNITLPASPTLSGLHTASIPNSLWPSHCQHPQLSLAFTLPASPTPSGLHIASIPNSLWPSHCQHPQISLAFTLPASPTGGPGSLQA